MTTTPPAPTLTGHTDAAPCPRVDVLITPMPSGAAFVSIYRYVGTAAGVLVRGASVQPVSGDFLVTDYEAPLGESIVYQAVTFDSSLTPSAASPSSSAVTLTGMDVWLQDPLDPTSAMRVGVNRLGGSPWLNSPSLRNAQYQQSLTVSPVYGGALPFASGDVFQAASAIPFQITSITSDATTDALRALLMQAFPLCVRVPIKVPTLVDTGYYAISGFNESANNVTGYTTWAFTGQTVIGPGLNVVISPRTWNTVAGEGATWNDIATLYTTWINVQRG